MPITVSCTECGTTLKAPDNAAGRKVKCPKCSAVIAVPAVAAEQISSEPPARTRPAPPPPARSSRDDDYEDRGRRRAERDDDYDDDPRPRRDIRAGDAGPSTGLQLGLGVAALAAGVVGAVFAFIPLCGAIVAIPVCGIALVLGLVGLIVAIVKKAGYAFPIAGTSVSVFGLGLAIYWYIRVAAALQEGVNFVNQVNKANLDKLMQDAAKFDKNFNPGGGNNPLLQGGQIQLAGGKATYDADLNQGDPNDLVRVMPSKSFTLNMTAGKTYQIDMMSVFLDSYLRLEDPAGKQVATDDDGGGGFNARIVYACNETGLYRISATTFKGGTGRFTLSVEER